MDRDTQLQMIDRLFNLIDTKSTDLAPEIYHNPIGDYIDADQAARERDQLFRKEAIVACFSCDIRDPGDFVTLDSPDVPVLVTRTKEGKAKAYINVCRHRGGRVATGRGKGARVFTCPYHAWSYNLEGDLAGLPAREAFADMEKCRHSLKSLPVAEKDGLVWVRPSVGDEIDPDAQLGGLQADFAALDLSQFHHFDTRYLRKRMNWKLVMDTFMEPYHIPALHKNTIADKILGSPAAFDPYGRNARLTMTRTNFHELRDQAADDRDIFPYATIVYIVFPNLVFIQQVDHVETWQIFPAGDGINESEMFISLYAPDPIVSDKARQYWKANLDLLLQVTDTEDFILGQQIQASFASGAQDAIIFGLNEPCLAHYHQAIRDAVGA